MCWGHGHLHSGLEGFYWNIGSLRNISWRAENIGWPWSPHCCSAWIYQESCFLTGTLPHTRTHKQRLFVFIHVPPETSTWAHMCSWLHQREHAVVEAPDHYHLPEGLQLCPHVCRCNNFTVLMCFPPLSFWQEISEENVVVSEAWEHQRAAVWRSPPSSNADLSSEFACWRTALFLWQMSPGLFGKCGSNCDQHQHT